MSEVFNFHKSEDKKNKHYFLSEELLVPRTNNCDTQRLNMFSNHINQLVHLKTPEFPKVFTNFENQVGEYSIAYKKAEKPCKIIAKVVKNPCNYDLVVQYDDGVFDIIHINAARNITEDYGLRLNSCVDDKAPGDTISEGEFLYRSDNFDDDSNFKYGVNLKALYVPYLNETYEDGVVITESAAKKLTSFKVEKTVFSVNTNDFLLNLYGDEDHFKAFPMVGDYIDSKILVGIRRQNHATIMYSFQASKLREVDPVDDEIIYTSGGTVCDIDIFCNTPLDILRKKEDSFSKQIVEVLENQQRYYTELATVLETIIPVKVLTEAEQEAELAECGHVIKHPILREENPNKYTDELSYCWKVAHEAIDENIKWRFDGKVFDNFKMQFTILKEDPLVPGSKLTGRYGNKGIVSKIIPDEQAPITEDGVRAEILLNALGVINRLNIAQLQEQHLNFMADHVLKQIHATDILEEKFNIFFEFLKSINEEEHDFFKAEIADEGLDKKRAFMEDVETGGIFIHQPPFFGNTTMEEFENIYRKHPEWCEKYKFVGVEKPMVMGDLYFIRLKHQPSNKTVLRSAANLNVKNLPAKSSLRQEKKSLYSQNPLRLGEMECTNLMVAKHPELVEKLLKTYATSEAMREEVIVQLLNPGRTDDGELINPLDMDLDVRNKKSTNRRILEKFLNVFECDIFDTIEED